MESVAGQSYFCHICRNTITPTLPSYECPQCNQGFIEKLSDSSSSSAYERDSENGDDLSMVLESVSNSMGNLFEVMVRGRDDSNANSNDRPSSSHRRDNIASGRFDDRRLRHQTVEHILAEFLSVPQHDGYIDMNNPIGFLVSNPGDYAWGREGLDTIVTQLFNQMDSTGPPPLAKEKIQELPLVEITEKQVVENVQCSVCWDLFRMTDKVRQLPCEHIYHDPCIVPWLQLHGTCPICRKLLSEDSDGINALTAGERLQQALWRIERRTCFRCHRVGHIARHCRAPRNGQGHHLQHRWGSVPAPAPTNNDSNWTDASDTAFEIEIPYLSVGEDELYDFEEFLGSPSDTTSSEFDSYELVTGDADEYLASFSSPTGESSSSVTYGQSRRNGRNTCTRLNNRAKTRVKCYHCDEVGHFARECPKKANTRPRCRYCYKIGHTSDRCWRGPTNFVSQNAPSSSSSSGFNSRNVRSSVTSRYRTPELRTCFRCNEQGHLARNCTVSTNSLGSRRWSCRACGSDSHRTVDCDF